MENNGVPAEQLCFVTIVFPFDSDDDLLAAKKKIDSATAELSRVKVEYRFTQLRSRPNNHAVHNQG